MAIGRVPHTKTKEKLMNRLKKKKKRHGGKRLCASFPSKHKLMILHKERSTFCGGGGRDNWPTLCNPFHKAVFAFWDVFEFWGDLSVMVS